MTGRRPDVTHCYNFIDHFREEGPGKANGADWITMPSAPPPPPSAASLLLRAGCWVWVCRQYFKENNYMTLGCGKTFHPNLPPNFDEPHSCAATLDTPSCPSAAPGPRTPDPPSIPPCTAQHL